MTIRVRALSDEEAPELARMVRSRTLGAGLVRRAQIVQHAADGLSAPEVAARMELCGATARFWLLYRAVQIQATGRSKTRPPRRSLAWFVNR